MSFIGCIKCGDEKATLKKNGFRQTKSGPCQIFQCHSCGKTLTGKERHRWNTEEEKQRALMEHEEGLSMRATARLSKVHLKTIQRWIEKKPLILSGHTTTTSRLKKRSIPQKTA